MEKVKIYTTPTCTYCVLAKQFFKDNKIEYEEFNVADDHKKAEEMIEKSGQMGVPVIDIKGTIIVGFDKHKVEHALGM